MTEAATRLRCSFVVAAALLASCGPSGRTDEPRLVVLYATCTLNKNFTAPYNAEIRFTPNLARFAEDAVIFERHHTEAGQSGPGFAALFSSTHADRHGVYHHPTQLKEELYLVAEAFADNGYETFFWNGHRMGSIELGYGQGVPPGNSFARRPPDKGMLTGTDSRFLGILERLRSDPDYKAFVQINFTLTHGPYNRYSPAKPTSRFCQRYPAACARIGADEISRFVPLYENNRHQLQWNLPETIEQLGLTAGDVEGLARVMEMLYSSCVHQLDRFFGQFMGKIEEHGLLDDSLIAFTADHGEILYRDNALFHWAHGGQLVPEVLEVPWILRWPGGGIGGGHRYRGVTRSIDVFPTLAGLARLTLPKTVVLDGVDLSPALREDETAPDLLAFFRTTTLAPAQLEDAREWTLLHSFYPRTDPALMWVGARGGDRMHVMRDLGAGDWGIEVFDLASDPEQRHDLSDPASDEQRAVARLLHGYRERLIRAFAEAPPSGISPEEEEEMLRALGYIR